MCKCACVYLLCLSPCWLEYQFVVSTIVSNICKKTLSNAWISIFSIFFTYTRSPFPCACLFGISINSKQKWNIWSETQSIGQPTAKQMFRRYFFFIFLHTFLLFLSVFLALSRIPCRMIWMHSSISNRTHDHTCAFHLLLHFISLLVCICNSCDCSFNSAICCCCYSAAQEECC